jgi:hypothetical protein
MHLWATLRMVFRQDKEQAGNGRKISLPDNFQAQLNIKQILITFQAENMFICRNVNNTSTLKD